MVKRAIDLLCFWLKGGVFFAKRIGVNVGNNCRIYTRYFGSEPFLISIGNNVTITANVSFITHDGSLILFSDEKGRRYKYQKIEVGNNVFIGVNSIVMPGIKIEDNVIVAAGSVLTKSVPAGVIVAGVPAKIIGNFYDLKITCLDNCISKEDVNFNEPFKDRILKIVDPGYKPYLKNDHK